MRNSENVFHLAIPTHDLDLAQEFYTEKLGCHLARRYDDRITLNFFGDQVVCHFAPERIDREVEMYPRHFGVTFKNLSDYMDLLQTAEENNLKFFQKPFLRFAGMKEEHRTFFLIDPSNNLLEFKYYPNSEMMY